ncbi:MAG: NADPH-dependent assimilatory sulfite reductase hemoprotein subunit [Verrucomicrobiota bacterium]
MTQPITPAKPTHNEDLKTGSPTLAGTIAQTLADPQLDRFSEDDNQFLKFHGIYQQDDRDLRKTGKKFMLMIRVRIPGGVLTPAQYLDLDRLSTEYGNNTLRVTSRQAIQFHGVIKSDLARTIKGINESLLTTIAACGDVVRNVMSPPSPATNGIGEQLLADAAKLSDALAPVTPAYHGIWIDGQELNLEDEKVKNFVDPLYGKTYLPRKFKIAFAIPPLNDVDVLANDAGLIAIVEDGKLVGYNLAVGGGMGRSHGNSETFPRVADVVGFITPDQVEAAVMAIVTIHRDFGSRENRKHARLKYILADRGVEWFQAELESRLGFQLQPVRPFEFTKQGDDFGWHQQSDGRWFLGLFVETGRIKDTEERRLKTALVKVVRQFQTEVRLTPSNSIILANVKAEDREAITAILAEHGIPVVKQGSAVRCASMACVSLPTCGLGLAESERYLPSLISRIESLLEEVGLGDQEITIRMTGCPNGCARPYLAEIGFVGKAPGKYQVYFGGNKASTRLNRIWKETVKDEEIINELRPVFVRYAQERTEDERFGDWVERAIWTEETTAV